MTTTIKIHLYVVAITIGFINSAIEGQEPNGSQDFSNFEKLILAIEQEVPKLTQVEFDFSKIPNELGLGHIIGFIDEESQHRVIENRMILDGGKQAATRWYFGNQGHLLASRIISLQRLEDGRVSFTSETNYFKHGLLQFATQRKKTYEKVEPINAEGITPTIKTAEELAASHQVIHQISDFHARKSTLAKRLLMGFVGFFDEMPRGILLESISPNSELILRQIPGEQEGSKAIELFNIRLGQLEKIPFKGVADHMQIRSGWSENSQRLVLEAHSKWTTEKAAVFKVGLKGSSVEILGNLYEAAIDYAWLNLKKVNHPITKKIDNLYGLLVLQSISNEGLVHFLMDTQSNSENPDDSISTEMVIRFKEDGNVGQQSFRLLGANDQVLQIVDPLAEMMKEMPVVEDDAATADIEPDWNKFSKRNVGPVNSETPFDQTVIEGLFSLPDLQVVPATEEFEDGGERSVLHMIFKDVSKTVSLLTIVATPDKKKISSVYSTNQNAFTIGYSPVSSNTYAIRMGSTFGESFSEIVADTIYEEISGQVVALVPGAKNIELRYSSVEGRPENAPEGMPSYEELKNWALYSIQWRPLK